MPPKEIKNDPAQNNFRVGIDPVFKSNLNLQKAATPMQNNPESSGAFGVLNNQQYTPTPKTEPFPPKTQIPNTNPKSIVRTFKGDLETAIQTDHLSSINIAIAENQKKHSQVNVVAEEENVSTSNFSKSKIIIFISVILVIIGIVAIFATVFISGKNPDQIAPVQELPSLITTEFKDELNTSLISKNKFISTLSTKLNDSQIKVNNFYNTYITTGTSSERRLVTSAEFISLAGFGMPDLIKRTLSPDFMIGTYSFGKNLPFLILKTSYYENAYDGMLGWERDMESDFKKLFRLPGYDSSGGILNELTPTEIKKFEDGVVVNKDIRLIRGVDSEIILMYGIIDKETIIITVSDTAFKEIIDRLNKEKTLKR